MERSAKDFLFDYIFSFSAYWICGGMIVAKLTEYFQFRLSVSNLMWRICLCGLFFYALLPARAGVAVTVAAFVPMSIAFQLCASPQGPAGNGVLAFSWSTECWSSRSGR